MTDTNGDGKVSLNEFIVFLGQEAGNGYSGDVNNDGFLNRVKQSTASSIKDFTAHYFQSEIPESLSKNANDRAWRVYEALTDTNDDGKVSLNEFIVYAELHDRDQALGVFKVADTNRDNFIDKVGVTLWF